MGEEDKAVLSQILRMMQSLDDKFERHTLDETSRLEVMAHHIESIEGIVQAFPHNEEGIPDFRGHRRDHDTRMESGKNWGSVIQSMKQKFAENIVNALMIIALLGYITFTQNSATIMSEKQGNELVQQVAKTIAEQHKKDDK